MKKFSVESFYDEVTATVTHVVYDPVTQDAVIIDPVLNYDAASSIVSNQSVDILETFLKEKHLNVHYALETHAHADHLSGAQELKNRFTKLKIAIGERITEVQNTFRKIYNLADSLVPDGRQFDLLLKDDQTYDAGGITFDVFFTPGHTPACVSYRMGDAVFTGDALFMPDTGTGRCDFPGGSSKSLYDSITQRLYTLPDTTRVFVGHDYKGKGARDVCWETTIGDEKQNNIHLSSSTSREEFIKRRDARDVTLSAPVLLLPSLQVNIAGGRLPNSENNGVRYLKIPISRNR